MSLVGALAAGLRGSYQGRLDRNEVRPSIYGAYDLFRAQNADPLNILTPDDRARIRASFGNTVQLPVMDAGGVVIRNVRSCTVPDAENTAKLITLTFATFAFGFTMTPSQHSNNDVSYEQDFNRKLEKHLIAFAEALDAAAANKLNIEKNQFFPANLTSFYPVVGNALQVSAAQAEDFYNQLGPIMGTMDYSGLVDVLSTTTGQGLINRLRAQGAGNGTNQSFQFAGLNLDYFTNRLVNNAGIRSTHFAVPSGMLALENRNDPDAVAGSSIAGLKEWGTELMPIVNLEMGTYYYKDCADRSALHAGTTGLTRTLVEGFEFSTDVCFVTAYNSDPANRYSPILKAEISAT